MASRTGLPAGAAANDGRAQQSWQKAQPAVLGAQLLEILVVVRPRQAVDLRDGLGEFRPRYEPNTAAPNPCVRCRIVQQHGAGLA